MLAGTLDARQDALAAVPVHLICQNLKTCATVAEAVGSRECSMEAKYDGWRLLAHVAEDGVHLYSRSGHVYDGRLPAIEAELAERFPAGTWLDGEAVALRVLGPGQIANEWGTVQSVLTKLGGHAAAESVTYMVFDLLAHGGIDARPLPLRQRRGLLEKIFAGGGFERVCLTATMEPTEDNHESLIAMGFEGSVVKALDAPYASGKRGAGWARLKPQTTIEAVVMGYKPGENGFKGLVGAIVFGQHDPETGKLVERGRCSGRIDFKMRLWLTEHIERLVEERAVFELAHHGRMKDGLRHPQFLRWRPDRTAESVVIHDA